MFSIVSEALGYDIWLLWHFVDLNAFRTIINICLLEGHHHLPWCVIFRHAAIMAPQMGIPTFVQTQYVENKNNHKRNLWEEKEKRTVTYW